MAERRFYDYVYKYQETNHSGVWSNLNRINPEYIEHPDHILRAVQSFRALAEYAEYSISAYRGIEWWTYYSYYVPSIWTLRVGDTVLTLPKELYKVIVKPSTYYSMSFQLKEVPDEPVDQSSIRNI